MNHEDFDDLTSSDETEEVCYGFCIPLKNAGMAWLRGMPDDVYIERKNDGDGIWYSQEFFGTLWYKKMVGYLNEIKSGEGNWIIGPGQSSFGIDWGELEYEKAAVVKRVAKVTSEYTYEEVK